MNYLETQTADFFMLYDPHPVKFLRPKGFLVLMPDGSEFSLNTLKAGYGPLVFFNEQDARDCVIAVGTGADYHEVFLQDALDITAIDDGADGIYFISNTAKEHPITFMSLARLREKKGLVMPHEEGDARRV